MFKSNVDEEKASGLKKVDLTVLEESASPNKIDPAAEAALVKKLDWTLLPLFTLICMYITHSIFFVFTNKSNQRLYEFH